MSLVQWPHPATFVGFHRGVKCVVAVLDLSYALEAGPELRHPPMMNWHLVRDMEALDGKSRRFSKKLNEKLRNIESIDHSHEDKIRFLIDPILHLAVFNNENISFCQLSHLKRIFLLTVH